MTFRDMQSKTEGSAAVFFAVRKKTRDKESKISSFFLHKDAILLLQQAQFSGFGLLLTVP